jgi:ABC-type uncharacterized transport system auxiliary subunit
MTQPSSIVIILMLATLAMFGCGGKLPETRFYQLAPPVPQAAPSGTAVLVLENLSTDPAYDDERIVYRTNAYRLDYYNYHRWSAAPGTLIGNYLETAFERTGKFRAVVRELASNASVILGGRVVAIEEVDTQPQWIGRVVIELTLTDARSGEPLWSEQIEETEPLATRTPEGLAKALSIAMNRIASRAAPVVADLAEQRAAQHTSQRNAVGRR